MRAIARHIELFAAYMAVNFNVLAICKGQLRGNYIICTLVLS